MAGAAYNRGASETSVATPGDFIEKVRDYFYVAFILDLAAEEGNSKALIYYGKDANALVQQWPPTLPGEAAWLNPPYDNIAKFAQKAAESPQCRTLMLVPASVGTNWYRDWCLPYAATIVLNGRITFEGHTDPYPKDLMLIDYGGKPGAFSIWRWK